MGCGDSPAEYGSHSRFQAAHTRSVAVGASRYAARGEFRRDKRELGIAGFSSGVARWLLLLLLRFYQTFLGPFLGGACKFHPSCSNYAYEAVLRHGARRGTLLALKRLGRCRPFTQGGFDPVPDAEETGANARQPVNAHTEMQSKELRQ